MKDKIFFINFVKHKLWNTFKFQYWIWIVIRIYLKMLHCIKIDFELIKKFVIIAFNNDDAAYHI